MRAGWREGERIKELMDKMEEREVVWCGEKAVAKMFDVCGKVSIPRLESSLSLRVSSVIDGIHASRFSGWPPDLKRCALVTFLDVIPFTCRAPEKRRSLQSCPFNED